jgi:probable rRNA maturation factor
MNAHRESKSTPGKTRSPYRITVQYACTASEVPDAGQLQSWASQALAGRCKRAILTIRLVDREEGAALNGQFRSQDKATNVLSFPADDPAWVTVPNIGDLVICVPVVLAEAAEQHKPVQAHFAHLTIHGVLHLLGHDHVVPHEAEVMEALEREILQAMGYADPYE